MITMTRLDMTTGNSGLRPAVSLTRVGTTARAFAADWKRWTLPEHVMAVALIALVVLVELAMSTSLASGGH